jgi:hypothetical protein
MSSPLVSVSDMINLKHNLLQENLINKIKNIVKEKLGEVNLAKFRMDPQLTLLVSELVLNCGDELGLTKDVDKNSLSLEIVSSLYSLNAQEQQQIKQQIEFLSNNKQIKKVKLSKKIFASLCAWVLKKIS